MKSNTRKKQQTASLEHILALMPGHLYWLDKNLACRGCNDNLLNTSRFTSKQEIIGKIPYSFMPKDIAIQTKANDMAVLQSGTSRTYEEHGLTKDGKPAIYLTQKLPIKNEAGNVEGILGVSIDITKQKNLEAQLKIAKAKIEFSDKLKKHFIGELKRDLQIPTTAIHNTLQELANQAQTPGNKKTLQELIDATKQLLELFDSFANLTLLQDKYLNIQEEPCDIKRIITNIVALHLPAAKQKKLQLSYKFAKNLPDTLLGDEYRISRILLNLVNHAIQKVPSGTIKIAASLIRTSGDEAIVNIEIKHTHTDKSIYDEDLIGEIAAEQRGSNGSLALVNQFIAELQSNIKIEEEGKYTNLIITMPFKILL